MKKIGYKTKAAAAAEAAAKMERKPARRNDARIIRRVIRRQESVTRKDIADWKRARLQATSTYEPKQVLLQRLFSEVIDDALMTSQVSVLRIGKSQGAEFELKMNGRKDEAETQKFKDSGLYEDLVELIVEAQFFNHSLIEFDYDPAGTVVADLVPRENVSPEVGKFYPDAEGSETVDYRLLPEFGRWLVEIYPRKCDLGLLNKAVPYVLIKKFALSCWSELCEIFGIPPRVMKTNTTDDEMLERAETMMREIGSAAYFIIDTTEDFEFAQGVATNGDVYKNLISTCDQQLSLLNLEKLWKMTYEASQNYDVDPEWIRDTFGIAVIGKKQQGLLPPGADGERQDGEGTEDGADGHAFFAEAPQDGASDGESLTPRDEALVGRVAAGKSDYWDAELFEYIASDLLKAVRTVFAHTSGTVEAAVEYDVPDDVYTAALEQNLFHFSAAKTLAEVQELNQAFRESKSYNEFKARAAEITRTFNDRWQRTEYRTAVQVAEAASNYRQLRRRADIFPYWVYRTAGDGQVRPSHAALDGLTLPASDPAWRKIFPPNDWNCRCRVEAIMADEFEGDFGEEQKKMQAFLKSPEWKRTTAQGWGVNRAETAEIFTANQMYIRKFPDRAASLLGKLHCQHYGLPSFGKRLAAATREFVPFSGDPAGWFAQNGRFTDFSGKTIELPERTFATHTSGKYTAARVPLLDVIAEVLRQPDEVWLNNYDGKAFDCLNYIRFYRDKAINVVCRIENGKTLAVRTWFEIAIRPTTRSGGKIAPEKDPRLKYRRGLLVKK